MSEHLHRHESQESAPLGAFPATPVADSILEQCDDVLDRLWRGELTATDAAMGICVVVLALDDPNALSIEHQLVLAALSSMHAATQRES